MKKFVLRLALLSGIVASLPAYASSAEEFASGSRAAVSSAPKLSSSAHADLANKPTIDNCEIFIDLTKGPQKPLRIINLGERSAHDSKESISYIAPGVFKSSLCTAPLPSAALEEFGIQVGDFWVNIAEVTADRGSWWNRRLSLEARMLLGKYFGSEKKQFIDKDRCAFEMIDSDRNPLPHYLREIEKLMICKDEMTPEYIDLFSKYSKKIVYNAEDYVNAIKEFNKIVSIQDGLTWVAYISNRPGRKPVNNIENIMSHDIKMFMTIRSDQVLGMRSPIGQYYDQSQGVKYENLAAYFHNAVAGLVETINASAKSA